MMKLTAHVTTRQQSDRKWQLMKSKNRPGTHEITYRDTSHMSTYHLFACKNLLSQREGEGEGEGEGVCFDI